MSEFREKADAVLALHKQWKPIFELAEFVGNVGDMEQVIREIETATAAARAAESEAASDLAVAQGKVAASLAEAEAARAAGAQAIQKAKADAKGIVAEGRAEAESLVRAAEAEALRVREDADAARKECAALSAEIAGLHVERERVQRALAEMRALAASLAAR